MTTMIFTVCVCVYEPKYFAVCEHGSRQRFKKAIETKLVDNCKNKVHYGYCVF